MDVVVFAVGNPSRGDDAIGPRLMAMLGLVGSGAAGALRSETSTAGR